MDTKRLTRFGIVGIIATLGYGLLYTLFETAQLFGYATASAFFAYGLCATFSYLSHKYFTFQDEQAHGVTGPRFAIATALGFLVALTLAHVGTDTLGLHPVLVSGATMIAIPIMNYALLELYVFRIRKAR